MSINFPFITFRASHNCIPITPLSTHHTTHHTPHSTHHTSHTTQHTPQHSAHTTHHTPHSTQHTPHITQHSAHTTHHTTHHTSHSTHHTPHITSHPTQSHPHSHILAQLHSTPHLHSSLLHLQQSAVQVTLGRGEAAIDRPCSGDVTHVTMVIHTSIHQHKLSISTAVRAHRKLGHHK